MANYTDRTYTLTFDRGDCEDILIRYKEDTGAPIALENKTAQMIIVWGQAISPLTGAPIGPSGFLTIDGTIPAPENGEILISVTKAQTGVLPIANLPNSYRNANYQIRLTDTVTGCIETILAGAIIVIPNKFDVV